MNDLVIRLCRTQRVEVSLRPERSVALLDAAVARGYVQIRFVETGTELSVHLDPTVGVVRHAESSEAGQRRALVGELVLNSVRVRCHLDIDVTTFGGIGHLEPIEELTATQLATQRSLRDAH